MLLIIAFNFCRTRFFGISCLTWYRLVDLRTERRFLNPSCSKIVFDPSQLQHLLIPLLLQFLSNIVHTSRPAVTQPVPCSSFFSRKGFLPEGSSVRRRRRDGSGGHFLLLSQGRVESTTKHGYSRVIRAYGGGLTFSWFVLLLVRIVVQSCG